MKNDSQRLHFEIVKSAVFIGLLLYIPANTIPVMTITINGNVEPLTVMGGVLEMYQSGLWPVALIIFLASIFIPLCKLLLLSGLILLHGSQTFCTTRTRLRRILVKLGSWSLIDIFLLSVITAVGQLGVFASVDPQPGSIFFSIVLLCNIIATELYRPYWIWEPQKKEGEKPL
jgi:paraquat-inducible protein A